MRLIDADRLKADFIGNRYGTQAIEYVIDQQPTVDPVKHGYWTKLTDLDDDMAIYECSECHFQDERKGQKAPYCWSCGAKMDEVTE